MSFLAPLYALGFLALAGPIILHLIRRQPKGEMAFSSLMFLTPSPPPPAQKRRLEQILLLLLRLAALALLSLAFMRPFLRQEAQADLGEKGRNVAILIDTSASMRRADLWSKAMTQAEAALKEIKSGDRLGIFVYDKSMRPLLSFRESSQLEAGERVGVAKERLSRLQPTWAATDLGNALIEAAREILDPGTEGVVTSGKMILISDLASGSHMEGLTDWEWPKDIELELKKVTDGGGNAGLDLLVDRAEASAVEKSTELRIRVTNDASTPVESFTIAWAGGKLPPVEAYVPPGESRVVKIARLADGSSQLILKGDGPEFDNTVFVPPLFRNETSVLYLGTDADNDPKGLRFFLERAWSETPQRIVRLLSKKPADTWSDAKLSGLSLAIVAVEPGPEALKFLASELQKGLTVVWICQENAANLGLYQLAGTQPAKIEEAKIKGYAMLRDIAFDHPLFSPLAGAQFGDFTRIQFWKHRRLNADSLAPAKVLARFDGGDPAVMEKLIGSGRLLVLASGWNPADSQLARSSKFVPLADALLALRAGKPMKNSVFRVGDRIPLAAGDASSRVFTVQKPDGQIVSLKTGETVFDQTDLPGVYQVQSASLNRSFAVNLDPAETLTTPLDLESLEQWGIKVAQAKTSSDPEKQMRDIELEQRQSLWRVLVLAAIGFLFVETVLAGLRTSSGFKEVVIP